jgi:hypothetical protein
MGDSEWHEGKSENISHSGVLFRGEDALEIDTPVEIRLMLSTTDSESGPSEVTCRGRVVRTIPSGNDCSAPVVAVTIECYEFERAFVPAERTAHFLAQTD